MRLLVVVALLLGFSQDARAQAWTQPTGGIYAKLSASLHVARDEYNFEGDRQEIIAEDDTRTDTSFLGAAFTGYVEYGLTRTLTLIGKLPIKIQSAGETFTPIFGSDPLDLTRRNTGISDLTLAARWGLLGSPVALAVQTGVKLPLGYDPTPSNEGPALGTGKVDGEVHVTAGRSVNALYVSAGGGYRHRGGDLNDEILFHLEAGTRFRTVSIKLRLDALQNTEDPPDIAGQTIETPFPGDVLNTVIVGDQDIFQLSSEVTLPVHRDLSVSGEVLHVLAGKDTITGTSFALGLVLVR